MLEKGCEGVAKERWFLVLTMGSTSVATGKEFAVLAKWQEIPTGRL